MYVHIDVYLACLRELRARASFHMHNYVYFPNKHICYMNMMHFKTPKSVNRPNFNMDEISAHAKRRDTHEIKCTINGNIHFNLHDVVQQPATRAETCRAEPVWMMDVVFRMTIGANSCCTFCTRTRAEFILSEGTRYYSFGKVVT